MSDDSRPGRLERRARKLLRAYPPGYREHRGEEILGTLLEATAPGRSWPSLRDTASVVVSGVRARREANQRPGLAASLRQAALLGVTLYLLTVMTSRLGSYQDSGVWPPGTRLLSFTVLAPVAAAWCGRRRLTAVTAVLAGAACAYVPLRLMVRGDGTPAYGFHVTLDPVDLEKGLAIPLLALAVLVLATRSGERPPRSWLWLPVLGAALPAALSFWLWSTPVGHTLDRLNAWVAPWPSMSESLPVIMVAVCVCWLVTDFRPVTGVAIGFALMQSFNDLADQVRWSELIETAAPLAAVLALAWQLRRRRRTLPPAAG